MKNIFNSTEESDLTIAILKDVRDDLSVMKTVDYLMGIKKKQKGLTRIQSEFYKMNRAQIKSAETFIKNVEKDFNYDDITTEIYQCYKTSRTGSKKGQ